MNIVDIGLGLRLFSTDKQSQIELFSSYIDEPNEDECLDDKVNIKIHDHEVREYLVKIGDFKIICITKNG
ncbi:hypothetical protein ACOI1C_21205 [Bacillus sp. DJP31]|uniref:hypothetical protein n=1 Tax=Bacillus sp. DJP31 TaxID=3409789 RepID=UPI003BB55BED